LSIDKNKKTKIMNLLQRLKDLDNLETKLLDYPHLYKRVLNELMDKEYIGELTVSTMAAMDCFDSTELYELFYSFAEMDEMAKEEKGIDALENERQDF